MLNDIRYASRLLIKSPGFTAIAVLTLALGIGANTAIFSVIKSVLLRGYVYHAPDRLAMLWLNDAEHGFPKDTFSYPRFVDTRDQSSCFQGVTAFDEGSMVLSGVDEPEQVLAGFVSAEFFSVLGVSPQLGRAFQAHEDQPGKDTVVVLSHGFWTRRFGADRTILGRPITLNGRPYIVVGVMPPGVELPDREDQLWVPLDPGRGRLNRGAISYTVLARLKDGVTLAQAAEQMNALNRRLGEKFPESDVRQGVIVTPLREQLTETVRTPLIAVAIAVGCVLLIACGNVAGMLLARTAGRRREISVRFALGAGGARVLRQLLTETLLLFGAGAIAGIALSFFGVSTLITIAPTALADLKNTRVDVAAISFAVCAALLTGLIFGLAPASEAVRRNLTDALKQRGAGAGSRQLLRRFVVVGQIAVAIVLLVGSGLLIRTLVAMERTPLGFRADHLLTLRVIVPGSRYNSPAKISQFYSDLNARVQTIPGVETSGAITTVLLGELPNAVGSFTIEGRPAETAFIERPVTTDHVTPGFFRAFGQPLVAGRDFNDSDREDSPPVIMINSTMATRYWPNENPIGKRFKFARPQDQRPWFTIVGVVGDTRRKGVTSEVWPESFVPVTQNPRRGMTYVVRTTGDPTSIIHAVRDRVHGLDHDQPIANFATMEQMLDQRVAARRFHTLLLALLGGTALLLASVGLYGVLAYLVAARTQEFGIRAALGAKRADILRLVTGHTLHLVAVGTAIGVAGAIIATRWMSTMLYGVSARDPLTFTAIVLVLGLAAAVATFVPVRRAMRIDPMVALREE